MPSIHTPGGAINKNCRYYVSTLALLGPASVPVMVDGDALRESDRQGRRSLPETLTHRSGEISAATGCPIGPLRMSDWRKRRWILVSFSKAFVEDGQNGLAGQLTNYFPAVSVWVEADPIFSCSCLTQGRTITACGESPAF